MVNEEGATPVRTDSSVIYIGVVIGRHLGLTYWTSCTVRDQAGFKVTLTLERVTMFVRPSLCEFVDNRAVTSSR